MVVEAAARPREGPSPPPACPDQCSSPFLPRQRTPGPMERIDHASPQQRAARSAGASLVRPSAQAGQTPEASTRHQTGSRRPWAGCPTSRGCCAPPPRPKRTRRSIWPSSTTDWRRQGWRSRPGRPWTASPRITNMLSQFIRRHCTTMSHWLPSSSRTERGRTSSTNSGAEHPSVGLSTRETRPSSSI